MKWMFDFRDYEARNKTGDELSEEQARGDYLTGSPAVSKDGNIYFSTIQGFLFSLDTKGTLRWAVGGRNTELESCGYPVVGDDGTVYSAGIGCITKAFNPDGALKWQAEASFQKAALGSNGILYGIQPPNQVMGLDAATGQQKSSWTYSELQDNMFMETNNLAIGKDGTVYVSSWAGTLFAFTPDLHLKWTFQTQNTISSSPAVASDGTVFIGDHWTGRTFKSGQWETAPNYDAFVYAITPDGKLKWKFKETLPQYHQDPPVREWTDAPAVLSDGTLFFGLSRCGADACPHPVLYSLKDGKLLWKAKTFMDIGMTPALGSDGTVYVGSANKFVWAFKGEKVLWRFKSGGMVTEPLVLLPGGTLYAASDKFYALKTESPEPSQSSWPRFQGNLQNTGQAE